MITAGRIPNDFLNARESDRGSTVLSGELRPSRVVPLVKPAARWHEGQLAVELMQRRSPQIFEGAFALRPRGVAC